MKKYIELNIKGKINVCKYIIFALIILSNVFGATTMSYARSKFTNTVTNTILTNNQVLGCSLTCSAKMVPGALLRDDPKAASLPELIQSSLVPPVSEWYGANIPAGASAMNFAQPRITGSISESDIYQNFTSNMDLAFSSTVYQSTPDIKRVNSTSGSISQRSPMSTPGNEEYQFVDIQIQIDSLTDNNGNVIGTVGNEDGVTRGTINMSIKQGSNANGSGSSFVIPQQNIAVTWSVEAGARWTLQ